MNSRNKGTIKVNVSCMNGIVIHYSNFVSVIARIRKATCASSDSSLSFRAFLHDTVVVIKSLL
jgi:hypothetical protein